MKNTARAAMALFCALLLSTPLAGCQSKSDNDTSSAASAAETTTQAATLPSTETTTPTTAPAAPEAGTGYCSVESLIVRGGPGTDYYGIGGLKFGEQVEILSREGDWFRIAFQPGPDGVGYVSAQYIQGAPPAPTTAPMTTASTEPVPTE